MICKGEKREIAMKMDFIPNFKQRHSFTTLLELKFFQDELQKKKK